MEYNKKTLERLIALQKEYADAYNNGPLVGISETRIHVINNYFEEITKTSRVYGGMYNGSLFVTATIGGVELLTVYAVPK